MVGNKVGGGEWLCGLWSAVVMEARRGLGGGVEGDVVVVLSVRKKGGRGRGEARGSRSDT